MVKCLNIGKNIGKISVDLYKKHIIFQVLYIIVGPLCPASLKRVVFHKAPPSDKHSLLWLVRPRALWLAEHHTHKSEM